MQRSYRSAVIVLGILVLIGIAGVFLFSAQPERPRAEDGQKLRIAATIYPLYDLARTVAGDAADVLLIVPPGASPHTFEITPRQLEELQGSSIIFAIGHDLDRYAAQVSESIPGSRIVTVDRDIAIRTAQEDAQSSADPHYWLHFGNARTIVDTITNTLSEADPQNAEEYHQNAEMLKTELTATEDELKAALEPVREQPIIVFHDAWFYFAEDFGLTIAGVFEPSAAEEPTARNLARLRALAREQSIKAFFIEPQLSSTAIESFAEELHLSIGTLDPLGGVSGRLSYSELMRYNVNEIIRVHQRDSLP